MSFVRKVSIALVAVFALNAVQAAEIKLPEFQSITLDNGATVLLMPRKDVPLVAASIAVRGGALADAAGKEGTADLLGEMLSKGAGSRDALQFAPYRPGTPLRRNRFQIPEPEISPAEEVVVLRGPGKLNRLRLLGRDGDARQNLGTRVEHDLDP